ncbi:MAG: AAA family ATPase [Actinobacteria bacterium]|nr:AAA family ATPase [Actinomycetota bacterium]
MLRELREQLARADAGDGGVVVVSGEAGVGKTRLVAKFARDAQRRGACVLGDPAHTSSFPYGPFAAAVEGYVAARPEHERAALARRYPTLGCLVPSVQIPALSLVTDDGSEATYVRLGTEIARLLTDVAEDQTVVLVLGDLDEAHPSSLGLLQYLANLARQRRWLVIATLRDEAMVPGSGALRMLTLMTYERLCVHVRLPRLGREESDRLARAQLQGRTLDGGFLERMYSRTDGNPLFIEELAREVAERVPDVDIALGADHIPNESFRVPPTVRAVVEKAITPLGSSVRRVLELAAVAGPQVPLEDLRTAAAELEPPLGNVELFDALDRLLSTRMMLEDQDAYAIRHALVREVLLQDLPQHRRAQLTAALGKTARKRRTRLDTGTRPISWPRVREPEPELH